jgi:hypothetical protein
MKGKTRKILVMISGKGSRVHQRDEPNVYLCCLYG